MTQPSTSGDRRSPLIDCAIAVSTPAVSSTRPKPPPAPTTSSTPAIGGNRLVGEAQQALAVESASGPERVERQERRQQHRDERAAGKAHPLTERPSASVACASAASSIRSTGSRIVSERDAERRQTRGGHFPAQLVRHPTGLHLRPAG